MSEAHPRPNYAGVFVSLFVLTIIEVIVSGSHLPQIVIVLSLIFFAIVKACLVALFYMHLRFEKVLLTVIAFAPLLFSVILTLMVGMDLAFLKR